MLDHADTWREAATAIAGGTALDPEGDAAFVLDHLGYQSAMSPETRRNRVALLSAATALSALFEIESSDAPGARVFGAIADPGGAPASVAGCDLTRGRAFERCVGEGIEYLSQFGDPELAPSPDGVTAVSLGSDTILVLPKAQVIRGSGGDVGSGCAAGSTLSAARLGALCELIERDAVAHWWYGDAIARDPSPVAVEAFAVELALYRQGVANRTASLLDIASTLPVPVMAAVSFRADGSGFAAGFAARPNPAEAALAALREMVQMELGQILVEEKLAGGKELNSHDRAQKTRSERIGPDHPKLRTMQPAAIYRHTDAPLEHLIAVLAERGMIANAVDLTRRRFGVPVASVAVTGLAGIPGNDRWPADATDSVIPLF